MRVEHVETELYRVPLRRAWGDMTHRVTHLEVLLSDVFTDTGLSGTGFSYTVGVGGVAIRALLDCHLAPGLAGREVAPRPAWREMWLQLHDAGGGGLTTMALAAVDIALWDLLAKERGRPLCELLGRVREDVPVYASGIDLNLSLPELEEEVRRWLDAGYGAVKVKVGKPEPAEDVERLAAVRRLLGPGRPLMVDANQGWDVTAAVRAARAFEPFDLHWLEEPLLADDVEGHRRLRQRVRQPLALGENVYTRYQFNEYLARGACDFVQADVVRVGGITPWLGIAALAETWDVPMAPHFLHELSGQLLCCIPNGAILEDVEGGSYHDLGVLASGPGVRAGRFRPPAAPGHGIELDRRALAPHRVESGRPAS